MAQEAKIIPSEGEGEVEVIEGNEPNPKPLSETGYQINPDGSVGHLGEKWDKDS